VKLSEHEACFVDAVHKELGFLVTDHAFTQQNLAWDGQGIKLAHRHPNLEISNYLESEKNYATNVMPLTRGKPPALFDDDFDEPFTYFELAEAFGSDNEPLPRKFLDDRDLEQAIARRAQIVRENVSIWLLDDGIAFSAIAIRIKGARLSRLVPRWEQFVASVDRGFDGGIAEYVAGVNLRGQIKSLVLKWPGVSDDELLKRLGVADDTFDRLTVPMKYGSGASKILPHERARRWWRLPEVPKGRLRDYVFRGPSGV
jgi:hypothetical protein